MLLSPKDGAVVPTHTELQKSYLQMKPREYRIEKFADKTFRVLRGTGSAGFLFLLREAPAANRDKSLAHELDTLKKLPATLAGESKKKVLGKTRIFDDNRDFFLKTLGIKSDIDLRSDGECFGMTGSPLGPSVRWIEASSWAYGELGEEKGKVAFARAFRPFLDPKNYPIDFHCITGADRTGTVAFILNALLGIGLEDLYRDWEATALYSTRMDFYHARRLDKFVAVVNSYPGKTLADKTAAFVKDCGFTDGDIAFLREFLLESE